MAPEDFLNPKPPKGTHRKTQGADTPEAAAMGRSERSERASLPPNTRRTIQQEPHHRRPGTRWIGRPPSRASCLARRRTATHYHNPRGRAQSMAPEGFLTPKPPNGTHRETQGADTPEAAAMGRSERSERASLPPNTRRTIQQEPHHRRPGTR